MQSTPDDTETKNSMFKDAVTLSFVRNRRQRSSNKFRASHCRSPPKKRPKICPSEIDFDDFDDIVNEYL